jgi:hypothetical protein
VCPAASRLIAVTPLSVRAQPLDYGEYGDPAKMTGSRMDLVSRPCAPHADCQNCAYAHGETVCATRDVIRAHTLAARGRRSISATHSDPAKMADSKIDFVARAHVSQ